MAVTEIAQLSIKNSSKNPNADKIPSRALDNLRHAISEQAKFSGHPVALLQCQNNPSLLFLVGGWESVSYHMDEWIPGPINQGLLKLLSEHVDVKFMFHLDAEPLAAFEAVRNPGGESSAVSVLARYVVKDGQKPLYEGILRDKFDNEGSRKLSRAFYGWRADLGFVADGNGPKMQDVANTVVILTADTGETTRSGVPIQESLEVNAEEMDARFVKVISLANVPEQDRTQ